MCAYIQCNDYTIRTDSNVWKRNFTIHTTQLFLIMDILIKFLFLYTLFYTFMWKKKNKYLYINVSVNIDQGHLVK